jgi:hypothetical protein
VAKPREASPAAAPAPTANPPWMTLPTPRTRALKVYALDPSAGTYVGNVMTVRVRWERNLEPGPVGRRFAVIDYDGGNRCYYPPVDLDDPRILAMGGLDPSESDPRFHQQMVYAVASETVEKFEAALGRTIHWRRAERPAGSDTPAAAARHKADDIWVLKLFPHAMQQANAFYSRDAQGIMFGYFRAAEDGDPGRNLPGQRIFTCLSHDIIAHEVTHAVVDGIRAFFTEPTNPDVLAFHEGFADVTALFLHFSHKEALRDTIRSTGGRLYAFELEPAAASVGSGAAKASSRAKPRISDEIGARNPLIELAQQFGEASGMGRALRGALDVPPDPAAIRTRVDDAHFRGSILVAALFDAYFSTYLRAAADLFRIYRAAAASPVRPNCRRRSRICSLKRLEDRRRVLPALRAGARLLSAGRPDVRRLPARADHRQQRPQARAERRAAVADAGVSCARHSRRQRELLFRDALAWPRVPEWTGDPVPDALPPVVATIADPETGHVGPRELVFGHPDGSRRSRRTSTARCCVSTRWRTPRGWDSTTVRRSRRLRDRTPRRFTRCSGSARMAGCASTWSSSWCRHAVWRSTARHRPQDRFPCVGVSR